MPLALLKSVDSHESTWHRRGHAGFAGALVLMFGSAVLTESVDVASVVLLIVALVVMAALSAVLFATDQLRHSSTVLLWPVATIVALVSFKQVNPAGASLLVGLFVLAFLFIGLSQPPGRGLWLLLPAAVAFVEVADLDLAAAIIRVPLSLLIWAASSELPSRLLTEVRGQREILRDAATKDSLTGLLNRSTLDERVRSAVRGSAVALLDIDHFKQYNDAYGHHAGDDVLAEFATMLLEHSRPGDGVFRYGGEEFLVIFNGTGASDAAAAVERYAEAWAEHRSGLSFSAGVAPLAVDGIRAADELLYRAKRSGRSRVVVEQRESA